MATNEKYIHADELYVPVPVGTVSGSPVVYGQRPGYALTSRDADGKATVKFSGAINTPVKGENNAGNNAVAEGDILYYEAGQTPPLNKDNVAGIRWGYAGGAVVSGATTTILAIVGY